MENKLMKKYEMIKKKTVFVGLFLFFLFGGLRAQNNVIQEEGCTTERLPFSFSVEEAWTSQTNYNIDNRNTPLAGDIDGDGMTEVVCVGSPGSKIYVFEGQTGAWAGSVTMSYTSIENLSPLLLYRPSANAKALLFVVNTNKTGTNNMGLYEVSSAPGVRPITFTTKWEMDDVAFIAPNTEHILSMPIVADFDGDGVAEFFAGGCFIDVATGDILASVPVTGVGGWYLSYPLAADVDGDGKPELIVGTKVYKFNRSAATKVTTYATCPGLPQQEGYNMVADINQDGVMDVVYHNAHDHSSNAYIKVWTPKTGATLGDFTILKNSYRSYPFVGDIDGVEDAANGNKKYPEICINTCNNLYAYSYTPGVGSGFTQKWNMAHSDGSGSTSLTLYDFNLDGVAELVYRDETSLRIFNGTSAATLSPPLATYTASSGTLNETPIVADVTGMGSANIVVTSGSRIVAYKGASSKWAACPSVWNQQLYSPLMVNNDLTVPSSILPGSTRFTQACNSNNGIEVQYYNGGPMQAPYISSDTYCPIDLNADPYVVSGNLSMSGTSVTFSAIIGNYGIVPVRSSMPIAFYKNSVSSTNLIGTTTLGANLLPGDTRSISKTFTVTGNPTQYFIRVLDNGVDFPALGDYSDCDLTNNTKAFGTLELTKTVDSNSGCINSVKVFTLKLTNNELTTRNNIVVTDSLGTDWEYVSAAPGAGTSIVSAYSPLNRKLEWGIPSLAPGDTVQLYVVVKATTSGTLRNMAWVKSINDALLDQEDKGAYVVVTVNSTSVGPNITKGSGDVCSESGVNLLVSGTPPYQWFRNDIPIENATGSTYNATIPGKYTVIETGGLCPSDFSNPVVLFCKPDNITNPEICFVQTSSFDIKLKQQWENLNAGNQSTGSLVGDLDGDGLPEIVAFETGTVNTDMKKINVYNGQTGAFKASIDLEVSANEPNGWNPVMTAVLVDANRNGMGEIIVTRPGDRFLRSYEAKITNGVFGLDPIWTSNTAFDNPTVTNNIPQPIVADFNGDGVPEVVVYNKIYNAENGHELGVTEAPVTTAHVGRIPGRQDNQATNFQTTADFDGDGLAEIVAGGKVYKVNFNAAKTAVTCTILYQNASIYDGYTAVADVNMDGLLDVVVVNIINSGQNAQTRIQIWTPQTGEIIDQITVTPPPPDPNASIYQSFPSIGDIDGNVDPGTHKKYPEICVTVANRVYAYKYVPSTGKFVEKWKLTTSDSSGGTGITLFDFNNDGVNELVYRDETVIRVLNGTADGVQPVLADPGATFPCISGTAFEYPVIADTDGDGSANICVTCAAVKHQTPNYLRVYESGSRPWATARRVWNQVNYEPLQINENLTIPQYSIPKNIEFNGQYPYNGALIQVPAMENGNFDLVQIAPDPAIDSCTWTELVNPFTLRVGVRIRNLGIRNTNAALPVALYGVNPASGTPLAVKQVGVNILPGDSYVLYFDNIPITRVDGEMSIRIQDDGETYPAAGSFLDCNYDNNIAPVVLTPAVLYPEIGYCKNSGTPLVAAVTRATVTAPNMTLKWYKSDGTTVVVSPSINTSVEGTIHYYVSQVSSLTSCESAKVPITITIHDYVPGEIAMRWTGIVSTNWHDPDNWVSIRNDMELPVVVEPGRCNNVIIPFGVFNYPEIKDAAACKNITIEDRAMIVGTHLLEYDSARVEIALKSTEKDRFVMWSAPLRDVYSGDYHYERNNSYQWGEVYMNYFHMESPDYSNIGDRMFTASFSDLGESLSLGKAFNLQVVSTTENREKKFIFPQTALYYEANGHRYPAINEPNPSFSRSHRHRFITEEAEPFAADTTFGLPVWTDVDDCELIQLVNPFLGYLDVRKFLEGNQNNFNNGGYYTWTGNMSESFMSVFVGDITDQYGAYTITTSPSIEMADFIPPLQSFFVEKKDLDIGVTNSVRMSPNWATTERPNTDNSFTLRSSATKEEMYVFRIKATQGNKTSYAVLHNNIYASPSYVEGEDMQVLLFDQIPLTVYTLSPTQKEMLSVNSSNSFSAEIPLGIRLKERGEVRLDFSNSRNFSHNVYLLDKEKNNLEVDLQKTPSYTFTFTPKPDGMGITTLNDRFSLRFKFDPTGNEDIVLSGDDWTVSSGNGFIRVHSTKGVMGGLQIYNLRGALLFQNDIESTEYIVPLVRQQTYIVKVKTGKESKTKKAYVN